MSQSKLPDGSYAFLGVLEQLETSEHTEIGEVCYYALLVMVKSGDVEPQIVIGRSKSLKDCIDKLIDHRDSKRKFCGGAQLTFEPPSDQPSNWEGHSRMSKFNALSIGDIALAQRYLGLP